MSTKAEQLIAEMENTNILMTKEMTFVEYTENLTQFQDMITKKVLGEEFEEGMRMDEAIYRLEAKARAKGIAGDPVFRKGISSLKTVNKEIAISLAGKKGENQVARTLKYINRPNTKLYRNVYISNGENETELDTVVLTDAGIIILEIKNTKDNLTITTDGRLVHSGDECYEKKPLGEKMSNKRKLLKERLEEIAAEKGINVQINIESFIVFSTPKGMRINVDDKFRREKWCFRTGLVKKIDNYIGTCYYSDKEMRQLDEMLGLMESQIKRFALIVDFDEIRADIANMMILFDEEPAVEDVVLKSVVKNVAAYEWICTETKKIYNIADAYERCAIARRTVAMVAGTFSALICAGAAIGVSVIVGRRA